MFSFRGHITLKSRSKLILKNLFLFNSKLNGRKLGLNTLYYCSCLGVGALARGRTPPTRYLLRRNTEYNKRFGFMKLIVFLGKDNLMILVTQYIILEAKHAT